jgi:serine/threonine protein kinase
MSKSSNDSVITMSSSSNSTDDEEENFVFEFFNSILYEYKKETNNEYYKPLKFINTLEYIKDDEDVEFPENTFDHDHSDIQDSIEELNEKHVEEINHSVLNTDDDINEIENIIYRFQEEFYILKVISNVHDRFTYLVLRKEDKKKFIISIRQIFGKRYYKNGIPKEILVFKRLINHPLLMQMEGWCKINAHTYAILVPYSINCDPVTCIGESLMWTQKYMKSLLEGVQEMHKRNVIHRDICFDNLVWDPVKETVTIIDYDNCTFKTKDGLFHEVGRDNFDAPEKLMAYKLKNTLQKKYDQIKDNFNKHELNHKLNNKIKSKNKSPVKNVDQSKFISDLGYGYDEKSDIYSIGVVMWMLINENHYSPSPSILKKWMKGVKKRGLHIKANEINLIFKLLHPNPQKRYSAEQALNHPFFSQVFQSYEVELYVDSKYLLLKALKLQDEVEKLCSTYDIPDFFDMDEDEDIFEFDNDQEENNDNDENKEENKIKETDDINSEDEDLDEIEKSDDEGEEEEDMFSDHNSDEDIQLYTDHESEDEKIKIEEIDETNEPKKEDNKKV